MNIASSIPKFLPLAMIQQERNLYVRGRTMFIQVMADVDDISETLLTYALSLNPGLPIHVQQVMIKQEVTRKIEQQLQELTETNGLRLSRGVIDRSG
jgi:hypothetical protein